MDHYHSNRFNSYKDGLVGINQYALKVKQFLISYSESFHSSDPRYSFLLNMTTDDIDLVLHEITSTQIEAFNLIDHIHKPKNIRSKRSLLPFGGLFHFFCLELQMMMMLGLWNKIFKSYMTTKLANPKF